MSGKIRKRMDDLEQALDVEVESQALGMLMSETGLVNVIRDREGRLRGDVWDGEKMTRPGWGMVTFEEFVEQYGPDPKLITVRYTRGE